MDKTRAVLFCIWLTLILAATLFFLYLTAQLINNAYLLHQYKPPTQQPIMEQRIIDDLQQRIEDLEGIFNRAEVYEITAYTHAAPGGDINGTGDGITANGLLVREGLVAVDPKVIPLGSKVWVQGFGVLKAADTGGAIRGNRLDIFMDSRQDAINFGRVERLVIVL